MGSTRALPQDYVRGARKFEALPEDFLSEKHPDKDWQKAEQDQKSSHHVGICINMSNFWSSTLNRITFSAIFKSQLFL